MLNNDGEIQFIDELSTNLLDIYLVISRQINVSQQLETVIMPFKSFFIKALFLNYDQISMIFLSAACKNNKLLIARSYSPTIWIIWYVSRETLRKQGSR